MLNIYVLDATASGRNKISEQISNFLRIDSTEFFLLPRINIKPVSPAELKFQAAPDICIIGSHLVSSEISEIAAIRKIIPDSAIVVCTTAELENISIFEQFARLGVDDTISENINASEFFRKIILLAKRRCKVRSGKLILVDSSKGGQGVTSIVGALGELLAEHQRKVLLIDMDSETQDLSRFLQVRPFINDNLQALLYQQRPVSEESVLQCISTVWEAEENLQCMPPLAESDELDDPRSLSSKIFLSILEILDQVFEFIIVDISNVRGSLQRSLYRVADSAVCVVGNDPASLYAAAQKICKIRAHISVNTELFVLECSHMKNALPSSLVRSEVSRIARLQPESWLPEALPFCSRGSRWPGSGNTLISGGSKALRKALTRNAQVMGLVEGQENSAPANWRNIFSAVRGKSGAERSADSLPAIAAGGQEVEVQEIGGEMLLGLPTPPGSVFRKEMPAKFEDLQEEEGSFESDLEPLISNARVC